MLKQWLKLCPPSFVICSDCFFFLDFISSRTQSFICLQILFFSPSTLVLQLQRSSQTQRYSPSTGKHRSVSISKECIAILISSSNINLSMIHSPSLPPRHLRQALKLHSDSQRWSSWLFPRKSWLALGN